MSFIVITNSLLFSSYGMSFACRISVSAASVASLNIGYVGAPTNPVRPGLRYVSLIAS